MKLFCECNSEWMVYDKSLTMAMIMQQTAGISPNCNQCGMYKWYDADHENMMHDLKYMNRC